MLWLPSAQTAVQIARDRQQFVSQKNAVKHASSRSLPSLVGVLGTISNRRSDSATILQHVMYNFIFLCYFVNMNMIVGPSVLSMCDLIFALSSLS